MKRLLFLVLLIIILCNFVSADYIDDMNNGLISGFTFDVNADDGKSNNDGSTNNGVSHITSNCAYSGCYDYDGTNDYISFSQSSDFEPDEFTLNLWVSADVNNQEQYIFSNYFLSPAYYGWYVKFNSNGGVHFQFYAGGGSYFSARVEDSIIPTDGFHMWTFTYNGNTPRFYKDGIEVNYTTQQTGTVAYYTNHHAPTLGSYGTSTYFNGKIDEVNLFDYALDSNEIDFLYADEFLSFGQQYEFVEFDSINFSNFNCTSCNVPNGDTISPFSTIDTTPTFSFTTNINSNCRIADENLNYTEMGDARNCSSGQGSTSHICSLTTQDELVSSTDYVYIACYIENFYNSTILTMDITGLTTTIESSILNGIQDSVIGVGGTIYSDQQVYLRDLNNNQVIATVDTVLVYGNQRWIFNYDNSTSLGLFNITPVVYVKEFVGDVQSEEIRQQVTNLIDSTKN